jgi:hypothetical protein
LLSLVAAAAVGGAVFTMTSVNAAPVLPSALQPSITDVNLTEDVQRRRCWRHWRSGRLVCNYVRGHYWRWSRRDWW